MCALKSPFFEKKLNLNLMPAAALDKKNTGNGIIFIRPFLLYLIFRL